MKIIDYNKFKDFDRSQQIHLKNMPKLKITKNGVYIKISKGLNKDLSAKDINEIYLIYQVLDKLIDEYWMASFSKDQLKLVNCLDCKKKYTKAMCMIIVQEVHHSYLKRLCIKCFNRRKKDGKIT